MEIRLFVLGLLLLIYIFELTTCSRPAPSVKSRMITDIEDLRASFRCRDTSINKWRGEKEIAQVRQDLLNWYAGNRRMLPWRGDKYDVEEQTHQRERSAYGTWVSEIMLQQTRVETVIPYWHKWMERFPSVAVLAEASSEDVNKQWAGLGYYSRAQRLLQGAQEIMSKHNGEVPNTVEGLKSIPGIGPYTAGAISSIAFGKAEPLVDGNVIRVFSRLRALTAEDKSKDMEKLCWGLATEVVDPTEPGAFNQALMELGATVCKPTNPLCETCPVSSSCLAKLVTEKEGAGEMEGGNEQQQTIPDSVVAFPFKSAKKPPREFVLSVGVFVDEGAPAGTTTADLESSSSTETAAAAKYLFVRRPEGGLLQNQWEFPNVVIYEEPAAAKAKAKAKSAAKGKVAQQQDEEEDGKAVAKEDVDVSAASLWRPLPAHLKGVLGLTWGTDLIGTNEEGGAADTAVCIDMDDDEVQKEATTSSSRSSSSSGSSSTRLEPIVHIFSHQRHTMYMSVKTVTVVDKKKDGVDVGAGVRETKWMTAAEILEAGFTSGCKKVLEAVESSGGGTGRSENKGGKGKKKRTKAETGDKDGSKKKSSSSSGGDKEEEGKKQPKISSFFAFRAPN
jgi:A/G-specific adenine glycosylase